MKQLLLILLFTAISMAQFSGFIKGNPIGLRQQASFMSIAGKGYAGMASTHPSLVNPLNTATWSKNLYTTFDFSVDLFQTDIDVNDQSIAEIASTMGGVAWISRLDSNFTIGLVMSPIVTRNGRYSDNQVFQLDTISIETDFRIDYRGGLNELKGGVSYRYSNALALGLDLRYIYGSLTTDQKFRERGSSTFIPSLEKTEQEYAGFGFALSSLMSVTDDLTLGLSWSPAIELSNYSEGITVIRNDVVNYKIDKSPLTVPDLFYIGAKYQIDATHDVYLDIRTEHWPDVDRTVTGWFGGFEYAAESTQFDAFYERAAYSLGAFYYEEPVEFRNVLGKPGDVVTNVGFTGGISIPFNVNRNYLNLGLSYNMRGDKTVHGLTESVIRFTIGITLSDLWYLPEIED